MNNGGTCDKCGDDFAGEAPYMKYCDYGDDPQGKNEHRWEDESIPF